MKLAISKLLFLAALLISSEVQAEPPHPRAVIRR